MGVRMAWREYDGEIVRGGVAYLIRPDDKFKPRVEVKHRVYGEGVVTAIRIRGGIKTACIKFEESGYRWILPDEKYFKVIE